MCERYFHRVPSGFDDPRNSINDAALRQNRGGAYANAAFVHPAMRNGTLLKRKAVAWR
jgi:hypothetical protein